MVTAELHSEFNDEQIAQALPTLAADAATLARLGHMLQAGGYQRTGLAGAEQAHQTRRFLAMMAISQRLMAQELKVAERDLVILAQPGFHLDMAMRPLADGRILLNDHAASAALVEQVLAEGGSLSESERQTLRQSVTDLRQQSERWHKIHALIRQQLSDAGLTPSPPRRVQRGQAAGELDERHHGHPPAALLHHQCRQPRPLNQAFAAWLQREVAGLTPISWVRLPATNGRSSTRRKPCCAAAAGWIASPSTTSRATPRTGRQCIWLAHSRGQIQGK